MKYNTTKIFYSNYFWSENFPIYSNQSLQASQQELILVLSQPILGTLKFPCSNCLKIIFNLVCIHFNYCWGNGLGVWYILNYWWGSGESISWVVSIWVWVFVLKLDHYITAEPLWQVLWSTLNFIKCSQLWQEKRHLVLKFFTTLKH